MEAHGAYTEAEGAGFVQPAAKQALGSAGGRRELILFHNFSCLMGGQTQRQHQTGMCSDRSISDYGLEATDMTRETPKQVV